jgi:beta-N-acetylhexosaminidase
MLPQPPSGAARRRLALLCVLALAALVLGLIAGSGGGGPPARHATAPPKPAVQHAAQMPIERQIGELLLIAFQGPGVPGYITRALRDGRASGVILFKPNAPSPAALRAATKRIQRAARGGALIAADQEGGAIRILSWAAPQLGQGGQSTPASAADQARLAKRDLTAAGVNVTLAPIADVTVQGSFAHGRSFPGGASQVAQLTAAAVRAYRGGRVAATLKHFPGLGAAGSNTDQKVVTISSPRAAVEARDLLPFKAGIAAGAPLVMASHAVFSGLDPDNIASQSPAILRDLLRAQLGFQGVVVTDSMEAAAVLARGSIEEAALRSLSAGADLLLLTGPGSFPRVYRQLLEAARRSPKFRVRIAEAAARVMALKRSLGLRE